MQDWFGPDWYAQGPERFAYGPPAGQEKVCGGGNFGYPCWGTRTTDRGIICQFIGLWVWAL